MTQYQIRSDLAPPERLGSRRLKSPESIAMSKLQVGQCFVVTDPDRLNAASCARRILRPAKFLIAKMEDGSGWGVWRTE